MDRHPFFFLVGGIFSLIIAMGIGRFAYTPLLPSMQHALSLSDALAGYLASGNYAGYFVGALFAGLLPIQYYKTAYLRWGLFGSVLTTLLMGFVDSFFIMLIIRFISGVASAFIFVAASSIVLDQLASSGKLNWAGYFYSGVGFGIVSSALIIPRLHHWEHAWISLAVFSSVLMVFVLFWLKDSPTTLRKEDGQKIRIRTPPRKWLPYLMITYGLEGLGYIVTGTFIVAIADEAGVFAGDASIVWLVVGLAAIPSCVVWAKLATKWGLATSLFISLLLQSIGIALPAVVLNDPSFVTSAVLFGATFMGITTLATTLARHMIPANSSRIIGFLTALYAFGQMVGPAIAGVLMETTQSFHAALFAAAGSVLLGAFLMTGGMRYEWNRDDKVKGWKIKEGL